MSELDDFHASMRMALTAMRTRHIKNIRWMRRVQAALVFVNAGFFALDIIAGNICLAILALAAIIFGSAVIIQGTRAINRIKEKNTETRLHLYRPDGPSDLREDV